MNANLRDVGYVSAFIIFVCRCRLANWVSVFVAQCAPRAYEATGESKYLEIGSAACQAALNDPLATKSRLESANLLYAVIVGRIRDKGTACDMYEEIRRHSADQSSSQMAADR